MRQYHVDDGMILFDNYVESISRKKDIKLMVWHKDSYVLCVFESKPKKKFFVCYLANVAVSMTFQTK